MEHSNSYLNETQMDALREIGNIGSGNAATALSELLEHPVDLDVPQLNILDYDTVVTKLGGPESLLVGLLLSLEDDMSGMLLFLLQKEFANVVLNDLIGCDVTIEEELDEYSGSAIKEVGNIMAASYINAIASLTDLKIGISVPNLCVDMAGSILSVPTIYYANLSDKILSIESNISNGNDFFGAHILMIPEKDSLEKLLASLDL